MKVAIIMGSTSDLSKVEPAVGILKEYGVPWSINRALYSSKLKMMKMKF